MDRQRTARIAGLVCLAGATVQVVYGVLAVAVGYPAIVEPRYEVLWALANAGMVAGAVGWLALDVARPRPLAMAGAALAVLGHVIRIGMSVVLVARPDAAVDGAIAATIPLMFLGMALLGIGTIRGRQLSGWRAWAPLLTVAAGMFAAPWYSIDKAVHFALLGLLWGPAWLLVGYLVASTARAQTTQTPTGPGSAKSQAPTSVRATPDPSTRAGSAR
jgi:hypothetical protein